MRKTVRAEAGRVVRGGNTLCPGRRLRDAQNSLTLGNRQPSDFPALLGSESSKSKERQSDCS